MKIMVLNRPAEAITTSWDGKEQKRSQQWCTCEVDGLVNSFYINSEPGKELTPGEYELSPKSFTFTNGRLGVNRPILVPVQPVPVKKLGAEALGVKP